MFYTISRATTFIDKIATLANNIGFLQALYLFAYGKVTSKKLRAKLKFCNSYFTFRGKIDRGVLSHLSNVSYKIVQSTSHPVEYIIDGGANIGVETLKFRHFYPDATIIAVEADPLNFSILKSNFKYDQKTIVINKGLWPSSGKLALVRGVSAEASKVEPSQDGEIDAVSIADLVREFGLPRIDLLKLDIEGAEEFLFSKGIEQWIGLVNAIVFECNPQEAPNGVRLLVEAIGNTKYKVYINGENVIIIKDSTGWTLESFTSFDQFPS